MNEAFRSDIKSKVEREKIMTQDQITLDFGAFVLDARLFDTAVARSFAEHLPYNVCLLQGGNELYGSIGRDLGEENPIEKIPPGGIAYTNNGNYVCIFFGGTPAWAVEHIGYILDDQWKTLVKNPLQDSVIIRLK